MDADEPRREPPSESVYGSDDEARDPDVPVGQAEPEDVEPEAPVELPTTSTDPPAAS